MRRHYVEGKCDDCGRALPVTGIVFWLNGYKMRVCSVCIRPYRAVILKLTPGKPARGTI